MDARRIPPNRTSIKRGDSSSRPGPRVVLALFLPLPPGLGSRDLWNQYEPRYSEIARDRLDTEGAAVPSDHVRRESPTMSYWKLPRAQRIVALFAISSLSLVLFPDVDLLVSSFFFGSGGFRLAASWWATALHESVGLFIGAALATVVGIYWYNRIARRNVGGVDTKVVGYVFLVLALGAGLVVNAVLKNGFGRARPRNVVQFGGEQQFTPAFVLSEACATNCSFSSGDSSGAFFSFAVALALSRRRAPMVAAAVYGGLVSFSRIASGAHFLSDTVVSFFVMWITADALYHFMLMPRRATGRIALPTVPQPQGPPARGVRDVGIAPSYARASAVEVTGGAR